MNDVNEILDDRGKRYGNYLMQAEISQNLNDMILDALLERGKNLAPDQYDALAMIAVKISRIVNGDPDYADNWRDIAGYATLVADRLDGKERP
jgi:hypothetical protein